MLHEEVGRGADPPEIGENPFLHGEPELSGCLPWRSFLGPSFTNFTFRPVPLSLLKTPGSPALLSPGEE